MPRPVGACAALSSGRRRSRSGRRPPSTFLEFLELNLHNFEWSRVMGLMVSNRLLELARKRDRAT